MTSKCVSIYPDLYSLYVAFKKKIMYHRLFTSCKDDLFKDGEYATRKGGGGGLQYRSNGRASMSSVSSSGQQQMFMGECKTEDVQHYSFPCLASHFG